MEDSVYSYLWLHRLGEVYWFDDDQHEADTMSSYYTYTGYRPKIGTSCIIGPSSLSMWDKEDGR